MNLAPVQQDQLLLDIVDRLDEHIWRQSAAVQLLWNSLSDRLPDDRQKQACLLLELIESQLATLQQFRDDVERSRASVTD